MTFQWRKGKQGRPVFHHWHAEFCCSSSTFCLHSSEELKWVPTEAVRATVDFRQRYLPHVPVSLLREWPSPPQAYYHLVLTPPGLAGRFLLRLNGVWRKRLKAVVARVKETYVKKIKILKRQVCAAKGKA